MKEDKSPSFTTIIATVWKVFFAILLIPAIALLVYVAVQVIPGALVTIAAVGVLVASVFLYWWIGR